VVKQVSVCFMEYGVDKHCWLFFAYSPLKELCLCQVTISPLKKVGRVLGFAETKSATMVSCHFDFVNHRCGTSFLGADLSVFRLAESHKYAA